MNEISMLDELYAIAAYQRQQRGEDGGEYDSGATEEDLQNALDEMDAADGVQDDDTDTTEQVLVTPEDLLRELDALADEDADGE